MKIAKDTMVSIHYTLHDSEGTELDSSVGKEPLQYVHGNGMLIPGLEKMLEGKEPGLKFKAVIEPKDAYGEYNDKLVVEIPREQFETGAPIEVGMKFQASTADGQVVIVRVIEVNEKNVKVDGNHELAGKQLTFDVEIIDVREATEEELASMGGCGGCGGHCGGGCGSCGGEDDGGCGCNGNCGGCGN
ncbi:MAG: peptidylprolyl isomerase [Treponema sp.]|nr:peptidylprolyl isomerase [Treponema sp.]